MTESQIAEITAHPLDECACGDYRRDHKDGTGACTFNRNRFDECHAFEHCYSFRLVAAYLKEQSSHADRT